MNQDQKELTLEESIKQVMQTLPPAIRAYLSQGKYTTVAKDLMGKYQLRIDQGGILEREIMLLLMGIENPEEFTRALADEAKLDQQTVNNIVRDINDQIFIPLKEEERNGVEEKIEQPIKTETYFHLENKIPPPPMPPTPPSPTIEEKEFPKLLADEKLLEDHEEPHIELKKIPVLFVPPRVAPAPPNLPGTIPPTPVPEMQPKPVAQEVTPSPVIPKAEPPKPVTPPVAQIPVIKSYTVDPYREPIDEEEAKV